MSNEERNFAEQEGFSSDEDLVLKSEEPEFYDPQVDDKDDLWAAKQRKGRTSDAILSCPGCLTTVCIDCQRHAKYPSQFRAMFVLHCVVLKEQILEWTPRKGNHPGKKFNSLKTEEQGEKYWPVECEECGTRIGVQDLDEVYHFFNVIPTQS